MMDKKIILAEQGLEISAFSYSMLIEYIAIYMKRNAVPIPPTQLTKIPIVEEKVSKALQEGSVWVKGVGCSLEWEAFNIVARLPGMVTIMNSQKVPYRSDKLPVYHIEEYVEELETIQVLGLTWPLPK